MYMCTSCKHIPLCVAQQGDTLECGPFTVAFAEAWMRSPPAYSTLDQDTTAVFLAQSAWQMASFVIKTGLNSALRT